MNLILIMQKINMGEMLYDVQNSIDRESLFFEKYKFQGINKLYNFTNTLNIAEYLAIINQKE